MPAAPDIHLALQDLADRLEGPTVRARAHRARVSCWTLPSCDAPRLLEAIVGMRRPVAGRVLVDDLDLAELDLEQLAQWRLACVAWLTASPTAPVDATLYVEEPLRRRGFSRRRRRTRSQAATRAWRRRLQCPETRGIGLALARATAQEPELVLAPIRWRRELRALARTLRDLGASRPTQVLWTTRG